MEKLTKENIYIDLRGKSKEELKDLYDFLISVGEKQYRETLNDFLETNTNYRCLHLYYGLWRGYDDDKVGEKTEVTIEQLKEILQPMETLEQKLRKEATERGFVNGVKFYGSQGAESTKPMLINDNIKFTNSYNCGLYVNNSWICFNGKWGTLIEETLEQQLQKAEAEVKRLKEEIKYKVGNKVEIIITEENRKQIIELIK